MLNTILNIVAKNLEHSLRWLQRAEPSRQDVEPLSKALKSNLGWERRGGSDHTELEAWTATPNGGLAASIKNTITALIQWGLNPGLNIIPASYTHRQVLTGVRMLGAKRLLNLIVDEVKAQTEGGHGSIVIDIATALVCAPDAHSFESGLKDVGLGDIMDDGSAVQLLQRRMTLREVLKIEVENAPRIHKKDPAHAEALIRLFRRVEAQAAHPQTNLMAHDDGMGALDATLQGALDGTLGAGQNGLMGDVSGHQGMSDVMGGGDHGDIMEGLMGGGGDGDDLLDPFGVGSGDLGDGMGFYLHIRFAVYSITLLNRLSVPHFKMSTALKSIKSLAPLLDRVLVQRIKAEAKTASGIFLPESSVKELNEAKVLAVGPGALDRDGKRITPSVQPGDKVLIPQFGGSPVKVGDEEYSLFRDHELLAKINE